MVRIANAPREGVEWKDAIAQNTPAPCLHVSWAAKLQFHAELQTIAVFQMI